MRRLVSVAVIAVTSLTTLSASMAQQPVVEERVEVNLVYVETLVTDSKGNTVAGLTKEDFLLSVGGRDREIDVFDANCTGGTLAEPEPNPEGSWRDPVGSAQIPRRIVLVFDYYNLPHIRRSEVLGIARYMLARGKTAGEEMMIVALANGVRIEQPFTRDTRKLDETLQRMEYDLTLYAREFGLGASGRTYFDDLATLMDVLAQYDGPKGVVLFSEWTGRSNENDLWFFDVAHHAAAARAAFYPVFTAGLQVGGPTGGPPGLSRLANESGGRTTYRTNDLSLGYARAQRDLVCRYGIGFYVDEDVTRPRRVSVRVTKPGLQTRSPEQVRFFSAEEQREGRLRAAIVDPAHFESPYVRAHVQAIGPASKRSWNTMMALHFRMKVDPGGNDLDVVARLERGVTPAGKFREQFRIEPTADGTPQPVTIYGDVKLKPGRYTLTVALDKSGGEAPRTTTIDFSIPKVPEESVILRGPLLAKTLRSGVLIRTKEPDEQARDARSTLTGVIGDEGSFQPLLIHQVDPGDTVMSLWRVCTLEKKKDLSGVVERRLVDTQGEALHTLEPVALGLDGKKVRCQTVLDTVAVADLGPGKYRLEVTAKDMNGTVLAEGVAFLRVR